MQKKSYYIVLILVIGLSVLFFGLSYSKNSGVNNEPDLISHNQDNIKVTYSKDRILNIKENTKISLGIINNNHENINYEIFVTEIDSKEYGDVYYTINDSVSTKLTNEIIYVGELGAFQSYGDYEKIDIEIWSLSKKDLHFKIDVRKVNINTLEYKISRDGTAYIDSEKNYRYYGKNPNNYIKYNEKNYRIIGLINNQFKLVSEDLSYNVYKYEEKEYITIDDFLRSTNNPETNLTNISNHITWLKTDYSYWLNDVTDEYNANCYNPYYGINSTNKSIANNIREIIYLDKNVTIKKGDGTIESPYEVNKYGK